jgi:DNA uptake protein ComE-like DNA-binding protein
MIAKVVAIVLSTLAGAALAQVGTNKDLLDANSATESELTTVPHIGAALAQTIVARRPFARLADLDSLLGQSLSAEQRQALYGRLFLGINLNTASPAEIRLIPGMTDRLVHEFEEYRPYTSLEQFRREIGKYVPAAAGARLDHFLVEPLRLTRPSRAALPTPPRQSERMAHEYEESRPYTSLEQFRREIGKYVDAKEVARLERYVTLD